MLQIKNNYRDAILVMYDVSKWLQEQSIPLWKPKDFTNGNILKRNKKEDFYTAYLGKIAIASFILKWEDPEFWPYSSNDSGFLHKLCIKREFTGKGISTIIFDWIKIEIKNRHRKYLKLDCDAGRPKLCNFYKSNGFKMIERKSLKGFDTAFFELEI